MRKREGGKEGENVRVSHRGNCRGLKWLERFVVENEEQVDYRNEEEKSCNAEGLVEFNEHEFTGALLCCVNFLLQCSRPPVLELICLSCRLFEV